MHAMTLNYPINIVSVIDMPEVLTSGPKNRSSDVHIECKFDEI